MKKLLKSIVAFLAWHYVIKLRKEHDIQVIGVVGSIGKTGTKRAIAQVLSQKYKVMWQDGNYNDIVSVPLVFFGLSLPSIFNPFAWLSTFSRMRNAISNYDYEIVVLEIGTDAPGQIASFARYVQLDLTVVTKLAPEHMEFFHTMQAVAKEELRVQGYSKALIVDETIPDEFGDLLTMRYETYGKRDGSDACFSFSDQKLVVQVSGQNYSFQPKLIGEHQMWALAAATLVGQKLGLNGAQLQAGVNTIEPMAGRMQLLSGKQGSVIIDDTYNAAPDAVIAALQVLQARPEMNRIAVLGNMNELGPHSAEAHNAVADALNETKINALYTIGPDANTVLADNVEKKGVAVMRANSPYEIGGQLRERLSKDTVILLKGSQNGVFLEEAIKSLLADPADQKKLVRQNSYWLSKKAKAFKV